MTTISRERLLDGLGKMVVMSRGKEWEGFGVLEELNLFGEGHFSFRPPGYQGDPIIDDLEKILVGGLIINDVSGAALIKLNGVHEYVEFSQITDCGLVKVPLKFSAKERWLPPPIPGGTWKAREIIYNGLPSTKGNISTNTVSLQGYRLRKRWEYRDFETHVVVPVDLPYSITGQG